ncbi:hypothetical protein SPACI_042330 [Sporomusa acidovorans DSM 3132]|uniref:Coat F domain protein n=1 Tax=Sporomusa acidovorans (strain ATCC 49682 / DSM 3132 / Mol) TaxID=1123286 RepID=A0ABZ3J6V0_SPOA4|nr:coat F domain protein [Sporomusa acidovorans DSM 3132]SDD79137.1 Coat F domain-containing protein [Sporomusa acidovorans]
MRRFVLKSTRAYAQQDTDTQLKQLFQSYAQQEQQHLSTINSILSGQVPSMNQGQQQGQQMQQSQQTGNTQATAGTSSTANQKDTTLCNDMLMTEKYVSGAYDSAIFEFADSNVRQALNHIQKEEQQHGEGIYNYLSSKGAYNIG